LRRLNAAAATRAELVRTSRGAERARADAAAPDHHDKVVVRNLDVFDGETTHTMQQAARVSDFVGFMYPGELAAFGTAEQIFVNPAEKRTCDDVTGRFG
jgi:hypothetical protein